MQKKNNKPVFFPCWQDCLSSICLLFGLLFLLAINQSHLGVFNSDEAIAGLMLRDFQLGNLSTFYWAQNYGGTIEIFALALIGKILGTEFTLRIVPIIELIVIAYIAQLFYQRFVSPQFARLGASILFVGSASWIWSMSRPMIFYNPTLIFGLTILLLVTRNTQQYSRLELWWLGLLAGLGWWTSPQIVIFLLAGAILTFWFRRIHARDVIRIIVAFVIGSSPWWIYNLQNSFASLRERPPSQGGFLDHIHTQLWQGFPTILGLRRPFSLDWVPFGRPVYILVIVSIGLHLIHALWRKRINIAGYVPLIIFIFFSAVIPTGWFVGSGRYYVFVFPFIVLIVMQILESLDRNHLGLLIGLFAVILIVFNTGKTLDSLRDYRFGPTHLDDVASALRDRDISSIYGDYWVVYSLALEDDVLKVSPYTTDRQPESSRIVRQDAKAAYVFWTEYEVDIANLERFRISLSAVSPVEEFTVGSYVLLVPEKNIAPDSL